MASHSIPILATLLAVSTAAHADGDAGKAAALLKQADATTRKAGCFAGNRIAEGCGDPAIFPDAIAKVEAALKADPSPPTLEEACRIGASAQGPERAWLVAQRRIDRVLAWCDASRAANHQSGPELSLISFATSSLTDDDKLAAMRALYGVGFTIARDANKVSVDYGAVDEAKLVSYIAELWVPNLPYGGAAKDRAHVLLTPREKKLLCTNLADHLKDRAAAAEWCEIQSIVESASALVAFRGKAVTYPNDPADAGLRGDELVLTGRPDGTWAIALTVAGAAPVDDQAHVDRLRSAIGSADGNVRTKREVAALRARADKAEKQGQARYLADEAKRVKARPFVAFGSASFETWAYPPAFAAGGTCDRVFFKAYPPKEANQALVLAVDGAACHERGISADKVPPDTDSLVKPTYAHESSQCPEKLAAPGKHEVAAAVYAVTAGVVGKEVRDGVVQDRWMSGLGKKLGTWKVSCVTP